MKTYDPYKDTTVSDIINKKNISKDNKVFVALGDLDELNSFIGHTKTLVPDKLSRLIESLQYDIVGISGEVAGGKNHINIENVLRIEKLIDKYSKQIPKMKEFVLPGVSELSGRLDIARAVARRAERSLIAFEKVTIESLTWINRLSDLLFVLARVFI